MTRLTPLTVSFALALVACQAKSGTTSEPAPITDRSWVLQELEGQPLDSADRQRPPTLTLTGAGTRASGFAGCNRFAGTYTLGPGTLEFGPLAMTRMACPSIELESRYARALAAVRQYRVERDELVLEAKGTPLARFAAQAGDSH